MLIEIAKRTDGGAVLRCTRADGTVSWQRQDGPQAAFFPLHDLTHFSVETVLGVREGFFGLVARGWEIEDTTGKGARGALPPDAVAIEHIVGFLDVERATGAAWSATDYIDQLAIAGVSLSPSMKRALTDDALGRIRQRRRELFGRWSTTAPGASLELTFDESAPRFVA
jgi:hypothetical protein